MPKYGSTDSYRLLEETSNVVLPSHMRKRSRDTRYVIMKGFVYGQAVFGDRKTGCLGVSAKRFCIAVRSCEQRIQVVPR